MRISLARTLSLLPLLAAPLAGCSDPIDPSNLADRAALYAREMVHQSGGGVAFTQEDGSGLNTIANGMQGATDGLAGSMPSPLPPSMASAMGDAPLAAAMAGMPTVMTTEEQFDDTADRLKIWLRERVLADANLESKTDDEAIYRLHPDPTCRHIPSADDPPGTAHPRVARHTAKWPVARPPLEVSGHGARPSVPPHHIPLSPPCGLESSGPMLAKLRLNSAATLESSRV